MKYQIGYTNCYIQDHQFYHLCSIPIRTAVEWVKCICPDSNVGGCRGKDLVVLKNEGPFGMTNGWLNKLFVIVSNDHGHNFALVNSDGRFSIYKKRFEE